MSMRRNIASTPRGIGLSRTRLPGSRKAIVILVTFLAFAFGNIQAGAETRTWTGGARDGKWGSGGNWSGGLAPTKNDDVVIPPDSGEIKTDGQRKEVKSLEVQDSAGGTNDKGTTITADGPEKSVDIKASGEVRIGKGNTVAGCNGNPGGKGGDVTIESGDTVTNDGTLEGGVGGTSPKGGTGGNVNVKGKEVYNNGEERGGQGGRSTQKGQSGGSGGNVTNTAQTKVHGGKKCGGVGGQGGSPPEDPDGPRGKTTTSGEEQVMLLPGDVQRGDVVCLSTGPGGTIIMAGLSAGTIQADTSVIIDSKFGTIDMTANADGTDIILAGSQIHYCGTVLLDPSVSLASITNPDAIRSSPEIIWVSFHGADDVPSAGAAGAGFTTAVDKGYTDLLKANGYDVRRYIQTGTPDVAMLNAADLVIISRSVASSSFQNNGATIWNGVTAPMIILNGYTARKSRMGYYTGNDIQDITDDIKLTVSDPTHPIFAGIALGAGGTMVNSYAGLATYPIDGTRTNGISVINDPINANGKVLATMSVASGSVKTGSVVIAEWKAGATLMHDGGAGTDVLGGDRLVFLTGSRESGGKSSETAGMYDLSEDGAKMFLNAVRYLLKPPHIFGLDHNPLGQAQLSVVPDGLLISNIGSTGQDGVRVALSEDVTLWHADMADLGELSETPDGAFLEVTSRGLVNGVAEQRVSVVRHEDTGAHVTTTATFPALRPSHLLAEYFLDGQLVLREENISPEHATWLGLRWPDSVDISWIDISFDWKFSAHLLTTPKGNMIEVDRVEVTAMDAAVPFGGYADVSLTAKGIPSLTITAERMEQSLVYSATNPNPADGALDARQDGQLRWSAGEQAEEHNVYFGDDKDAVQAADTSSPLFKGTQSSTVFEAGELEWGKTYSWRVDEAGATGTWKGTVWSFTTANFIPVDDFESYTDDGDWGRIYQTWIDGLGYTLPEPGNPGNGTGATVGYMQPPSAETTIVHGGRQSMPLSFDNAGPAFYSEAERTFDTPQDWTVNGVDTLTLYFQGKESNTAESLYVAIQDSASHIAVMTRPNSTNVTAWTEWRVPLSQFAGLNFRAIKKMCIGVGDRMSPAADGSGILYIDDIRVVRDPH